MAKKTTTASVLSFEKKFVPSDALMYGVLWENRNDIGAATPLQLKEKSVRGTISNRLKATIKNDPLKLDAEVGKPNLQQVDSCALAMDQDTLKLTFTLKVLSGVENPSACNNQEFHEKYTAAAQRYIKEEKFLLLAKRYAENIANGRFFWRNRVGTSKIEVQVETLNLEKNLFWSFAGMDFNIKNFTSTDKNIESLGGEIAKTLSGESDFLLLQINAFSQVGAGQDVYPSEELILDKGNSKNKKSKILYSINDIAGMHSQKIGNALRTIDTWYPDYVSARVGPIAIEPYGAVTNLGRAYRPPKAGADFYTLFDKFARGEKLENKNDEHYVMAVLVRGGVFGESN